MFEVGTVFSCKVRRGADIGRGEDGGGGGSTEKVVQVVFIVQCVFNANLTLTES